MKKYIKKLDYKLLLLLVVILIGICLSVILPRVESAEQIVIEIDKKSCQVSLLNRERLIAKLKAKVNKECKIYLITKN